MKILFFGDSITDMRRERTVEDNSVFSYGVGYPNFVIGELDSKFPRKHQVINRGISGNRVVDLYARAKLDCWNHKPDLLAILIGTNDIWARFNNNGTSNDRFEKIYRALIEDTIKELPDTKIVLFEPFALPGNVTTNPTDKTIWERFSKIEELAVIVKNLAKEYNLNFIPLQEDFNIVSKKYGVENYLFDGVHPAPAGAKLIADKFLDYFYKNFEN
ncbi:MAG: SGNH/GDSL hydrolase family protein [Clostridia bacterium]|nr:SGNH/GDSL hydrolase family protein [Clostridia bacterium]